MATIGFSTKFPWGEETRFVDKIWIGLIDYEIVDWDCWEKYAGLATDRQDDKIKELFGCPEYINEPKIHTIREDAHDLWKAGRKIHPVVFNRTKDRFQFAPVLECKSVQKFEIEYINDGNEVIIVIDGTHFYNSLLGINKGIDELATNDGFLSPLYFFMFFNKNFSGKIISWLNYKY